MIDLVYCEDGKGNSEICVADYLAVRKDDDVMTEFGLTTVIETVSTYGGDDVYDFCKRHRTIRPVLAVLKKLVPPDENS